MKSLVLAEKPSVAKDLARVLGCQQKSRGHFQGSRYLVTWALGHLVGLAEPHDYDKRFKEWRLEDLPIIPGHMKLKVLGKTSFQFRHIRQLLQRGDVGEVVIATDAGREGELVARWILQKAGWKKQVRRLWISSQTDKAIRQGFASLASGAGYMSLYAAAESRARADWLIGLNVTRALTCKHNIPLNAGRVQTPTLHLLIQREQAIISFTPRDFYTLQADFGSHTGLWQDAKGNSRIFDAGKAENLCSELTGAQGIIERIDTKTHSQAPPKALDLTALQREANQAYGFSAHKTLSLLQTLYERHKLVTYPRTDSRYITTDMVPTLTERLKAAAHGHSKLVKPLLQAKLQTRYLVDDKQVSDHHALLPTEEIPNYNRLDTDERRIYDMVALRFITVLYPPHKYQTIKVITLCGTHRFVSQANHTLSAGWKQAAGERIDRDSTLSPDLRKGRSVTVKTIRPVKSRTRPPAYYTEATLLAAMEHPEQFLDNKELKHSIQQGGLGTPATRADIIEKLIANDYIQRRGRELIPTAKGRQLIKLVPDKLRSVALTAKWEMRLTRIAQGEEKPESFLNDIRSSARELVAGVAKSQVHYVPSEMTRLHCPQCGQRMFITRSRSGAFLRCSDPACSHRQPYEDRQEQHWTDKRKKRQRPNRQLLKKYSANKAQGLSLGDLLKQALSEDKKNTSD